MLLSKPMLSVRHAVSSDDNRYNLTGVHLDPANNRAEAANGHFMLRATAHGPDRSADFPAKKGANQTPLDHSVTIPIDAVEAVRKVLPKKSTKPILLNALVTNGTPDRVSLNVTDLNSWNTIEAIIYDGFPDCDLVIPKEGGLRIGFSAAYLITICKAVIEAGGKTIILTPPSDPLCAMRIDATGEGVDLVGALMPIRL